MFPHSYMKWTTKAAIQRVLATVPAGRSVYYLGQRYLGGLREFTIDSKVRQGLSLVDSLFALNEDISGWRAVEIGTGWAPVVPLLFWAYGQSQCDTYDVSPLLKRSLLVETIEQLAMDPTISAASKATTAQQRAASERLSTLHHRVSEGGGDIDAILGHCGIRYHPAADAACTGLPDSSVDLVFSNVVLEHVPIDEVHRLFRESARILRPNGYMVHLIDPSDHFSHSDPTLSPVNFLRFSEDQFAKYNSPFLFQNRVRASAWREVIQEHRFEISYWKGAVNAEALRRLPSLPIDSSFKRFDAEDLCTTAVWVVARRPAFS